ncbi:MAG: hypothetical protein PHG66_00530 [Candidatus Colwellbacteria bacterium]|nr:hypothetical protein [Candidatus Colwellbacteria bacterium]
MSASNSRIDTLTKKLKSLRTTSLNQDSKILFTRFFKNYFGSMWWMLEFYESENPEYKQALEDEYGRTFPESMSNGDLLEIGKFIKKWTGYPDERTPGWIHYMGRLQERAKIARENVTLATQQLRFEKAGVDKYIIPDLANIVGDYFVA